MAKDAESAGDDTERADAGPDADGSEAVADDGAEPTSADIDAESAEGDRISAGEASDDEASAGEASDDEASAGEAGDDEASAGEASDDEASAGEKGDDASDAERSGDRAAPSASKAAPARRRASRLWWALPILMVVEFWAYGHDGRIEVCVGKEGHTDFSLSADQARTDANRWKFPHCETRTNLGLRSHHDELVTDAVSKACVDATRLIHKGETKACIAAEGDWRHHVDSQFVPPWDPEYYQHLFWFLQ